MPIVLLESVRIATYHLVSVHARGVRVQSGSRKANIGLTNKFDSQVIQAPWLEVNARSYEGGQPRV